MNDKERKDLIIKQAFYSKTIFHEFVKKNGTLLEREYPQRLFDDVAITKVDINLIDFVAHIYYADSSKNTSITLIPTRKNHISSIKSLAGLDSIDPNYNIFIHKIAMIMLPHCWDKLISVVKSLGYKISLTSDMNYMISENIEINNPKLLSSKYENFVTFQLDTANFNKVLHELFKLGWEAEYIGLDLIGFQYFNLGESKDEFIYEKRADSSSIVNPKYAAEYFLDSKKNMLKINYNKRETK